MTPTQQRRGRAAGPNPKVLAVIAGVVALAVAAGLAIALSGGDDDDEGATGGEGQALVHGTVEVEGEPLPEFTGDGDDAAVGATAPTLTGQALDGSPIEVGPGESTLLVFLAHWCPHCQAELPLLVDMAEAGDFDGIRTVAVLTGTTEARPNFPPAPWLEREGWTGEVLVDDEQYTAARAFGLTSYPYLVVVGADGTVTARSSGELPAEQVRALVETAR